MNARSEWKYIYRRACTLLITALACGSFYFVWYRFVTRNNQTGHLTGVGNQLMAVGIYAVLFIFMGRSMHAFKIGVNRKANVMASLCITLFLVNIIEIFISMAITGQFRFGGEFAWRYTLLFLAQSVALAIISALLISLYRKIFPPLQILEVHGDHENHLPEKISTVRYKYNVEKSIHYEELDEFAGTLIRKYDAVLINDLPAHDQNHLLKLCFEKNKRAYLVPKISDVMVKSSEELNLIDTPLYLLRNTDVALWRRFFKRFFDILLSSLTLVLFSPLFALVAFLIHREDGGPVFYRQERCTINEKKFMILKFRSMVVDAEKDGRPHPAEEHDDRITKVGRVIRSLRIDELPQLINVLKGDMSLVGPRPERTEHVEKYKQDIPEFAFRTKMKAGLTGYAQVYGKYNTTALDKLKLDLIYIMNYNLKLDLQIIFETVKILVQKESTEGFSEERISEILDKE